MNDMSTRLTFDEELSELSNALIRMGALASEAISKAINALTNNDAQLANSVIAGDRDIDDMERTIEHQCLTLLLRQQPVAGDLRKVSTAIKMITDIERIGDAAADIAELTIHARGTLPCLMQLRSMASAAKSMVEDAIKAYVNENLALAAEVIQRDDEVDDYFNTLKKDIATEMAHTPDRLDSAIDALMVAKYLERLGDHAVNISEWVQFYKTGYHKNIKIV
ncbi:MAG: phosphate signaling complex protein PhoU [Oscillospiraceae bacterium]